eukprot:114520_1
MQQEDTDNEVASLLQESEHLDSESDVHNEPQNAQSAKKRLIIWFIGIFCCLLITIIAIIIVVIITNQNENDIEDTYEIIEFDNYLLDLKYNRIIVINNNSNNITQSCNLNMLKNIETEQLYLNTIKANCNLPFVTYSQHGVVYNKLNQNQYIFLAQYNASYHYLPSIIFLPLNKLHLQLIILYANIHNYALSIRSGGHQYSGLNTCYNTDNNNNKCILIDMSNFNDIILNSNDNTLILESGLRVFEVYNYLSEYNMFVPMGDCHTVGVGGNLQTSGVNVHLFKKFGSALDYITSFEILLSNNTFLNISKTHNKNMFNNMLGYKSNPGSYGIITKYKLNTTLLHDKYYKNSYKLYIVWKYNINTLKQLLLTLFDILADNWNIFKNNDNNIAPFISCHTNSFIAFSILYVSNHSSEVYNNPFIFAFKQIFDITPEYQILSEYGYGDFMDLSELNYYFTNPMYPNMPPYKIMNYNNLLRNNAQNRDLILNETLRSQWINYITNQTECISNDIADIQAFFWYSIWGDQNAKFLNNSNFILEHEYYIQYIPNETNYYKALKYIDLINKNYEKYWSNDKKMSWMYVTEFNDINDNISINKYWNKYYDNNTYNDLVAMKRELDPINRFRNRFTII